MLTWVDLLALMVLALSLALGYRGGLVLAWVGLLGLPLYAAALALGLPAFWTALAVGLVLGALANSLPLFLSEAAERGLGLLGGGDDLRPAGKIGRASCRERVSEAV